MGSKEEEGENERKIKVIGRDCGAKCQQKEGGCSSTCEHLPRPWLGSLWTTCRLPELGCSCLARRPLQMGFPLPLNLLVIQRMQLAISSKYECVIKYGHGIPLKQLRILRIHIPRVNHRPSCISQLGLADPPRFKLNFCKLGRGGKSIQLTRRGSYCTLRMSRSRQSLLHEWTTIQHLHLCRLRRFDLSWTIIVCYRSFHPEPHAAYH